MGIERILSRRDKIEKRRNVALMAYAFVRGANMAQQDNITSRIDQFYKLFDINPDKYPKQAIRDEYFRIQKNHLSGSDDIEDGGEYD